MADGSFHLVYEDRPPLSNFRGPLQKEATLARHFIGVAPHLEMQRGLESAASVFQVFASRRIARDLCLTREDALAYHALVCTRSRQ
jgi:hypothetical protein